jgi:hypothetical protein
VGAGFIQLLKYVFQELKALSLPLFWRQNKYLVPKWTGRSFGPTLHFIAGETGHQILSDVAKTTQ